MIATGGKSMNELTERLTVEQAIVMGGADPKVEGHLILNDDPVRCIADIDLATLKGTGRLALEEEAAATHDGTSAH
jgi:hypothetical protein